MGLLRAAIVFTAGYFTIQLLKDEKQNIKKLDNVPIIGPLLKSIIENNLKSNKCWVLLIIICLIELIL